jgi:hypothetical protein
MRVERNAIAFLTRALGKSRTTAIKTSCVSKTIDAYV